MKKNWIFLLLILPSLSYADSIHLASASVIKQDQTTGSSLGYTGINNGKYITTLGYAHFSEDDWSLSRYSVGVNYSIQSIHTGSVYLGIGVVNDRGSVKKYMGDPLNLSLFIKSSDKSGFARLGYSKLSGVGIDYDYSLVSMDGKTAVGAVWRGAINDSNLGWLLGMGSDGDVETVLAGLSLIF